MHPSLKPALRKGRAIHCKSGTKPSHKNFTGLSKILFLQDRLNACLKAVLLQSNTA